MKASNSDSIRSARINENSKVILSGKKKCKTEPKIAESLTIRVKIPYNADVC